MPGTKDAQTNAAPLVVGVDVGTAFTDVVAIDNGVPRVLKFPSTPATQTSALAQASERLCAGRTARVIDGSTEAVGIGDGVVELFPTPQGAGVAAATYFARAVGIEDFISCDVGASTAKVGLVVGRKAVDARSLNITSWHGLPARAGGSTSQENLKCNESFDGTNRQHGLEARATRSDLDVGAAFDGNLAATIQVMFDASGRAARDHALIAFGGAGGVHACVIAQTLGISRIVVPPYSGVLSALGMAIAPRVIRASQDVLHLGAALDDERLPAEFGRLSGRTVDVLAHADTATVEAFAEVRFVGQTASVRCRITRPTLDHIREQFLDAYRRFHGDLHADGDTEIVALHIVRTGKPSVLRIPQLQSSDEPPASPFQCPPSSTRLTRSALLGCGTQVGPFHLIDATATAYVAPGWRATAREHGAVVLER